MNQRTCTECSAKAVAEGTIRPTDIATLYARVLNIDVTAHLPETLELRRCTACDVRMFVPARSGDARFYDQLSLVSGYYAENRTEFESAGKRIGGDDAVLEVGAGSGLFAGTIGPRRYIGLELNPRAAAIARDKGLDVREALLSDSCDFQVDVAVAFQVLEHVERPTALLAQMAKQVRPGGRLLLSVPNADGFMGALRDNPLNLPPHHLSWWTKRALVAAIERVGLEVVSVQEEEISQEHLTALMSHLVRELVMPSRDRLVRTGWAYLLAGRALGKTLSPLLAQRATRLGIKAIGHSLLAEARKR